MFTEYKYVFNIYKYPSSEPITQLRVKNCNTPAPDTIKPSELASTLPPKGPAQGVIAIARMWHDFA